MNWETAKTWMIVLFLVLDSVLGWQVVQGRRQLASYVQSYSDLLANTKTLLADHGFVLAAQVPTQQPDLPFVHADYFTPAYSAVVSTAFPNTSYTVDGGSGEATSVAGTLRVLDKGVWLVTYTRPARAQQASPADPLSLVWHGDEYQRDMNESNVPPVTAASDSLSGPVDIYVQKYQSYPIFDSQLRVQQKNGLIAAYSQTCLSNIHSVGDAKPILSALDALNNLANAVDKSSERQDNKILSVRLGFTHKASQSSGDAAPLPADTYWFPVWRVVTSQQTYFVNAFTGEVLTVS